MKDTSNASNSSPENQTMFFNQALQFINHINKILIKTKSQNSLMREVIDQISNNNNFHSAWIILTNSLGTKKRFIKSSNGGKPNAIKRFDKKDFPACAKRAIQNNNILVRNKLEENCSLCEISENCLSRHAFIIPISSSNTTFGCLSLTIPEKNINNKELINLFNELGEVIGFTIHKLELASRAKKQQKENIKKLKQFELVMNATNDGLYDWNLKTNEIYYSPGWKKMLGYQSDELPDDLSAWEQLIHEDDKSKSWDMAKELIDKKRDRFEIEFKMKHKDGRWINILSRAQATFDKSGNAQRIIGTHVDITERKKFESEQIGLIHDQQVILDNAPALIIFKDTNNNIIRVTESVAKLSGIPRNKIEGRHSSEVYPDMADKYWEDDLEVIRTGKSKIGIIETLPSSDGKKIWLRTDKIPYRDENNLIKGIIVFSIEITDLKNAEQSLILKNKELTKSKLKAEESDQLKTAFIQNLSHEIRTPMNSIIGFSEMLDDPALLEVKRKLFRSIIIKSSNQLLSIVNDILTISSIDTNSEENCFENVSINNLIDDLLTISIPNKSKNIGFRCVKTLDNEESIIVTDLTKITQIITNLLNNAIKFTHKGLVELGYSLKNNQLEFYVKDTGIGIGKSHQKMIFERFRQANISTSQQYGGTGLGLAISKGFVELLGGKIWVQSAIGEGSTFYFSIPYQKAEVNHTKTLDINVSSKLNTILVAEDEPYNYLLIEEFLVNQGFTLIHAKNGEEAIRICKTNMEIDLILMDIKMPKLDGYSAAKQIKQFRPNLPIIAQSAYVLSHERDKYSDLAFDDFITKPIDVTELKQKLINSVS